MAAQAVVMNASNEWIWACEIQQRFMEQPRPVVNGLDYSARCRQLDEIGGDFYHLEASGNDRLTIAVGDASGKGLPGALMVSNVQSSIRTATLFAGDNLPVAIEAVNRQVYQSSLADRYATLFYGILDSTKRTLRYVNAGHNPPLVLRPDGSIASLEIGGAPVGMFPDWKYQEGAVQVRSGDVIVAYTDGVVEATNSDGEEWGTDGLQRAIGGCSRRTSDEMIRSVFAALDEFTGGLQTDDATVVVLRVL